MVIGQARIIIGKVFLETIKAKGLVPLVNLIGEGLGDH
jgi:hypothetical protein